MNKKKIISLSLFFGVFILAGSCYCRFIISSKESGLKAPIMVEANDDSLNKDSVNQTESNTGKLKINSVNQHEQSNDSKQTHDGLENGTETLQNQTDATESLVVVHVCGSVQFPGVYTLTENSRIVDAVAIAGGFTSDAAQDVINQAQTLVDGQRIYIPSNSELTDEALDLSTLISTPEEKGKEEKVNINLASKEELMTLPGIGEAKACSIVAYRKDNGYFNSIDDIQKITGIKQAIFQQIKDWITVGKE